MNTILQRQFLLLLVILLSGSIYGQATQDTSSHAITFDFKNDTLYSNTGIKIFVGQKLTIGKASVGDNYRSVISAKAAIVPSIWGQDKRYENSIENYVASRKNRERLQQMLIPGNTLTVKKIQLSKTGRPHFYMATLSTGSDICKADIRLALETGELLLQ